MINNNVKFDYTGKTVLVTGCAAGIGRAIAVEFGKSGANVVAADINESGAKETVSIINETNPNAAFVYLDVTDEESIKNAVDFAVKTYGAVDILVNNAGVSGSLNGMPMTGFTGNDWDRVYSTNLKSVFLSSKYVYDHMVARKSGKIINIASTGGKPPAGVPDDPLWMEYASIKAAVIQLTRYQAIELGPHNINVNAICPGVVYTNIWEKAAAKIIERMPELYEGMTPDKMMQDIADSIPMRRLQDPEDMAYMALFLASDAAANITGQAINVCGGAFLA